MQMNKLSILFALLPTCRSEIFEGILHQSAPYASIGDFAFDALGRSAEAATIQYRIEPLTSLASEAFSLVFHPSTQQIDRSYLYCAEILNSSSVTFSMNISQNYQTLPVTTSKPFSLFTFGIVNCRHNAQGPLQLRYSIELRQRASILQPQVSAHEQGLIELLGAAFTLQVFLVLYTFYQLFRQEGNPVHQTIRLLFASSGVQLLALLLEWIYYMQLHNSGFRSLPLHLGAKVAHELALLLLWLHLFLIAHGWPITKRKLSSLERVAIASTCTAFIVLATGGIIWTGAFKSSLLRDCPLCFKRWCWLEYDLRKQRASDPIVPCPPVQLLRGLGAGACLRYFWLLFQRITKDAPGNRRFYHYVTGFSLTLGILTLLEYLVMHFSSASYEHKALDTLGALGKTFVAQFALTSFYHISTYIKLFKCSKMTSGLQKDRRFHIRTSKNIVRHLKTNLVLPAPVPSTPATPTVDNLSNFQATISDEFIRASIQTQNLHKKLTQVQNWSGAICTFLTDTGQVTGIQAKHETGSSTHLRLDRENTSLDSVLDAILNDAFGSK